MKTQYSLLILLPLVFSSVATAGNTKGSQGPFSRKPSVIEKERPELNDETKRLIAAYRREPSEANKAALRKQVEANYDQVVARKKAKLEELRRTAKHQSLVQEMEEIVNEVVKERSLRIEQSMRRFTDPRLRPGVRTNKDGFLPIIGAAKPASIAHTPVTNAQYAEFITDTSRKAPKHWPKGAVPAGKAEHPVVNVTYSDAQAYCKWMSQKSGVTYRLPTEEEILSRKNGRPRKYDY